MRKLLVGGIALLATMLLNAEDTKVSSYNTMIDDQMNQAAENAPEMKVKVSEQKMEEREDEKMAEQKKWNKLSEAEQHKIANRRMEKRDEGMALVTKRLNELDNESQKLSEKKSGMMDREQFDRKQRIIDQKRAKLMEIKMRFEKTPDGENVDMESPMMVREEIQNASRHR